MRLKTYTAVSMAEAMAQIRGELGEEAIIVSTETERRGRAVRVVAAVDEAESDEAALPDWSAEEPAKPAVPDGGIGEALAYHGVPPALAERLGRAASALTRRDTSAALAAALDGPLGFQPLEDRSAAPPLMLVGPPGVGKTTVAAKLIVAAHRRGRKVMAVTCDATRAGGLEQLEAFTRILGLPLQTANTPHELAGVLESANGANVIIDTAGINPLSLSDMKGLRAMIEQARAEPLLVLAAGIDASEAGDLAAEFASIGCRRMIATRLDVTRRVGGLLNAADAGRLAFAGITSSPHAAESVGPVGALALARLLLSPMTKRASAARPRGVLR
jgi:flagellar biosynthesis protein FlhF